MCRGYNLWCYCPGGISSSEDDEKVLILKLLDVSSLPFRLVTIEQVRGSFILTNYLIPIKKQQIFLMYCDNKHGVLIQFFEGKRIRNKHDKMLENIDSCSMVHASRSAYKINDCRMGD